MPSCIVVIPARYASSRFPGKPLVPIAGKPMIQHVFERARQARLVDTVLVATDDQRIADVVTACGGQAVMTASTHPTGTDRIAEVAATLTCDIVVNVQGDEPGVAPEAIDALVQPLLDDAALPMSTLARPLRDVAELVTPNVNKVVVDRQGHALYFSRSPIPYYRTAWPQAPQLLAAAGTLPTIPPGCQVHMGLYAYRREFLLHLAQLPQTPLEQLEQLEQLRVLEHGYRIRVVPTTYESVGVDTPEDVARAERLLAST
ncbi:MAG: 3-deoxy-manno-octulosonate cytidylyltransferase [Candidatus Tectomicrobia bacterium]|uniref:3-deoxy-manno-octulosonate cytidylyltransferase n=1 Tax=Tectimicrobiota bacterium TaxID=2528274 RepID=A0A937VZX8_UNCTE|nr:3-deoxy-manno-octulosonate cytidylyltransferase [Candidatus Tectomicrobia bacterium]